MNGLQIKTNSPIRTLEVIVKQEVIPATGHKPEIRNAVEATLTTPGYTGDTYCSVCNELLKQGEEIPKTGAHITWIIDGKPFPLTTPITCLILEYAFIASSILCGF